MKVASFFEIIWQGKNMALKKIYLPKWCYVLVYLYTTPDKLRYNEKLFRKLDMATSHVRTILNILLEQRLIKKERRGKVKFIELSSKGIDLAQKLWSLMDDFRQEKEFSQSNEHFIFPESKKGS